MNLDGRLPMYGTKIRIIWRNCFKPHLILYRTARQAYKQYRRYASFIGNTLSRNNFGIESKHTNSGTKYLLVER